MKKLDLTGKRFGKLTVLSQLPQTTGASMWNVRCDCGNEKILLGTVLNSGNTKSCGCLRRTNGGRPPNKDKKYIWESQMNKNDLAAMEHLAGMLEYLSNGHFKFNERGYFSKGRQYTARTRLEAIARALNEVVDWRS